MQPSVEMDIPNVSLSPPPWSTPSTFPLAFAVRWDSRTHMSSIPVRSTRRLILQMPRRDLPYSSIGARCRGGSRWLRTTVTFYFNGRGATAASGVTATVGDDDIISMGRSNVEMAIH